MFEYDSRLVVLSLRIAQVILALIVLGVTAYGTISTPISVLQVR